MTAIRTSHSPHPWCRHFAGLLLVTVLSPLGLRAQSPAETLPALDSRILADGIWVGRTNAGDSVFRFAFEGDRLTGHSYLVRDGKALSETPVVAAKVETESAPDASPALLVELRLKPGWTYRGRLSADGTVLDGELDMGRGGPQELDLRHAGLDAVPALMPRPPVPPGAPAYVYQRPAETGDGWTTANAADAGLELTGIQGLVADVMAGEAGLIHSLLLVKGGKLVVEEYFHGFSRDDLHGLYSVTKSVASLLVGLAIQNGDLAGVDTPVLELFPGLRETAAPGWEGLTVEHLLEMTSGADWKGRGLPPAGPALVRTVLERPPVSPVGAEWRYVDVNADLLAAVLYRATGVHADVYAERHLFAPLGITSWDWEIGKEDGFPRLYGTLRLRPRDMAKLGAMILAGGRWNGRQVVAEEWVRESTREHVHTPGEGYGYMWWNEPAPPTVLPGGVVSARGVGSQFIIVVPDLDLSIVVTGGNSLNDLGFRIGGLLLRHLAPRDATIAEPAKALRMSFEDAARRGLSGNVMMVKGGEVVYKESYGLANVDAGIPVDFETVFYLASVSKQITATAVLQLEEKGLLSTEDHLGRFFDAVPDDKKPITVHQLLTHMSGLVTLYGGPVEEMDHDEAVARTLASELKSAPGDAVSYSNSGYNLLSVIVEKASGKPFADYVRENVFKPAGMRDAGFVLDQDRWPEKRVAHCYANGVDRGNHIAWGPVYSHMGSGGVVIDIDDLYAFERALWSGALISEESRRKMLTPNPEGYGYGMEIDEKSDGHVFYQHTGHYHGCYSLAVYSPENDSIFVMLLNSIGPGRFSPAVVALIQAALIEPPAAEAPGTVSSLRNR